MNESMSYAPIGLSAIPLVVVALLGAVIAGTLLPRARTPGALRLSFAVAFLGALAAGVLLLAGVSRVAGVLMSPWAVGFVLAAVAALAGVRLWGWFQGIVVVLSGRARIGDRVALAHQDGLLTRAGLLRAELASDDGTVWSIPWALFGREVMGLSPSGNPLRVDVVVRGLPEVVADSRRRVARAASLCPFRVWTRPVEVRIDPVSDTIEVRLWTWSSDAAPRAEDFVREATLRALEGG